MTFETASDITDELKLSLDREELVKVLTGTGHTWGTLTVNMQTITDVDYNKTFASVLPAMFPLLANPDDRRRRVDTFQQAITTNLNEVLEAKIGRNKSSIYLPLMREANRLGKLSVKNRKLILYSDLAENTDSFSVYRIGDFTNLKKQPQKVLQLFEKLERPGDLHGVEIHLVFQPKNNAENEIFRLMSDLLKKELQQAGATVHIGANLVTQSN